MHLVRLLIATALLAAALGPAAAFSPHAPHDVPPGLVKNGKIVPESAIPFIPEPVAPEPAAETDADVEVDAAEDPVTTAPDVDEAPATDPVTTPPVDGGPITIPPDIIEPPLDMVEDDAEAPTLPPVNVAEHEEAPQPPVTPPDVEEVPAAEPVPTPPVDGGPITIPPDIIEPPLDMVGDDVEVPTLPPVNVADPQPPAATPDPIAEPVSVPPVSGGIDLAPLLVPVFAGAPAPQEAATGTPGAPLPQAAPVTAAPWLGRATMPEPTPEPANDDRWFTTLGEAAVPFAVGSLAGALLTVGAGIAFGSVLVSRRGRPAASTTRPAPDLEGVLRLGKDAVDEGDNRRALGWFELASRLDPHHPATHLCRGLCLAEEGHRLEAYEAFKRAFELDPADAVIRLNLAKSAARLGRTGEAMDVVAPVLHAVPELAEAIADDGAFKGLRDHPRWLALMGRL